MKKFEQFINESQKIDVDDIDIFLENGERIKKILGE
tara:strand:+ start:17073 stop:17180 length:108 start_codon:yes stop_codon:yes gene_type:complete